MIKAIIVDDEPSAGEVLQTLVTNYTSHINICTTCHNIPQALEAIKIHKPNIIFLDIELADGSGFEVLENLNGLDARVIFVTAYEHYAIQAIKYNAFDYILKPIMPQELNKTVDKIFDDELKQHPYPNSDNLLKQLSNKEEYKIAIPTRKGLEYYFTHDIIFVKGEGSYAKIHLMDGKEVLVSKKLKEFEVKLNSKGFIRIHKSYIINTIHVAGKLNADGGYMKMINDSLLPISNTYKESVEQTIKDITNII